MSDNSCGLNILTKTFEENKKLKQEIGRLSCVVELLTNLKQQAESEVKVLEKMNEELKSTITTLHVGKYGVAYYFNLAESRQKRIEELVSALQDLINIRCLIDLEHLCAEGIWTVEDAFDKAEELIEGGK